MSHSHVHLSGLDSLRWYSALAVIITHVEMHKGYHGLANCWSSVCVQNLGPAGVYFFFALSGFLITWLLQRDRNERLGTILPEFYRRRAGRILPLYYLLVFLGFVVLPQYSVFSYGEAADRIRIPELIAFVTAQPHVASAFLERIPNISHLWSIGVELAFYCFWPLLILRSKRLERSVIVFITGMLLIKVAVLLVAPRVLSDPQPLFHFAATLKFECMAIGAWFALPMRNWCNTILNAPQTTWFAFAAMPPLFLLYGTPLDNAVHLPMAVLFGVVIRSAAFSRASPTRFLDNAVSRYLGRISYGIYCYHVLCISLILNLLPVASLSLTWMNIVVYTTVIVLTTAISALSFEFFELPITRRARGMFASSTPVRQGASCT